MIKSDLKNDLNTIKGYATMIKVKNLRKEYDGIVAVNNISFEVKKGEIFALLGPNGAGKTTTIKAILGLINYDGEIHIDEKDAKNKDVKKFIGYLPETVSFYDNLTALQTLQFFAELKGADKHKCMKLLEEFGLKDSANRKVGEFSKGMKQRLALAQCLLGNPKLLILDEPTSGLDALGAYEIRNKIKEMNEKGVTILLCSHILSEVQELADRVAIMNKGEIIAMDTVKNLGKMLDIQPKLKIEVEKITDSLIGKIKEIVKEVKVEGNLIEVSCSPDLKLQIINEIEKETKIIDFKTIEPTLEEIFIKMVRE